MPKITQIVAREILDSRSDPTVETIMVLDDGSFGSASIPSGTSTGTFEAVELRDKDPNRYFGQGVLKVVNNVNNEISRSLVGQSLESVQAVDDLLIRLDGTPNKSRLGANAILSVSIAATKALAFSQKMPLYRFVAGLAGNSGKLNIPTPVFNMINGGKHGAGNLDFQEFQIIPVRNGTYASMLQTSVEIYQTIKGLLSRRGAIHSVGYEGGFAPNLFTNLDALEILVESITECHKKPTVDIELGLDVASNTFFKDGKYTIKDRSSPMESADFIEYLRDLNNQYHLRLLEDALYEDDWAGWTRLTAALNDNVMIVADDLVTTNKERIQKAIETKACTAIIVKPNQIGTITETIAVVKQARAANLKINVSHRSGETNDTFIADFAVGVGADYAKFGAPCRGERVAKYNRFLVIESELGAN